MTHSGIRLLAAMALATAAASATGVPAEAAGPGEVQLVTVDQFGLEHTIRHADGTWQPMGYIPGYHTVSALTSALVGGEEHVFLQYDNGSGPLIGHLVRHADGTWDLGASTPTQSTTGPATDLAVADVNGRLDLVRLDAAGPAVSELGANGQWSFWSPVPINGRPLDAIAATADGDTLRVVALTGNGWFITAADRSPAGWTIGPWTGVLGQHDSGSQLAAAQIGPNLQVAIAYGDLTDIHKTFDTAHTILDRSGSWSEPGKLGTVLNNPGCDVRHVATSAVNGELQFACVDWNGRLLHSIRHADGTWQSYGDVLAATGAAAASGPVTMAGA
ncbi:hypothetical protein [Kutzneria sp. NPDC052558]|uniref:hypothetical protein n=1 Tax=Kutzneria sp. NPDC052558 TaxID=3364121 RepID=UPI0037C7807A